MNEAEKASREEEHITRHRLRGQYCYNKTLPHETEGPVNIVLRPNAGCNAQNQQIKAVAVLKLADNMLTSMPCNRIISSIIHIISALTFETK